MLLRSSSTPVLNSWIPHSKDSSPEPEMLHQIPRTRSITLAASRSTSFSLPSGDDSMKNMTSALSENDLPDVSVPKRKPNNKIINGISVEEKEEEREMEFGLLKTASLDCGLALGVGLDRGCEVLVGGGVGGSGGKICGGGGGSDGGDGDGNWGSWDSNHENDSTDVFYQKMIEANPGNALLLSNYARFLKEVRADFAKAEEYCGRAILANPSDGNALSMYADLIWHIHKNASRAQTYFDEAVKAAPDDCYVLASYARFLWDAEDEEGEQMDQVSQPSFFHGAPRLTAA